MLWSSWPLLSLVPLLWLSGCDCVEQRSRVRWTSTVSCTTGDAWTVRGLRSTLALQSTTSCTSDILARKCHQMLICAAIRDTCNILWRLKYDSAKFSSPFVTVAVKRCKQNLAFRFIETWEFSQFVRYIQLYSPLLVEKRKKHQKIKQTTK